MLISILAYYINLYISRSFSWMPDLNFKVPSRHVHLDVCDHLKLNLFSCHLFFSHIAHFSQRHVISILVAEARSFRVILDLFLPLITFRILKFKYCWVYPTSHSCPSSLSLKPLPYRLSKVVLKIVFYLSSIYVVTFVLIPLLCSNQSSSSQMRMWWWLHPA